MGCSSSSQTGRRSPTLDPLPPGSPAGKAGGNGAGGGAVVPGQDARNGFSSPLVSVIPLRENPPAPQGMFDPVADELLWRRGKEFPPVGITDVLVDETVLSQGPVVTHVWACSELHAVSPDVEVPLHPDINVMLCEAVTLTTSCTIARDAKTGYVCTDGNRFFAALLSFILFNQRFDFFVCREESIVSEPSHINNITCVLVTLEDGTLRIFYLGKTSDVLQYCSTVFDPSGDFETVRPIEPGEFADFLQAERDGHRGSFCVAYCDHEDASEWPDLSPGENDLSCIAVLAYDRPVRPEAAPLATMLREHGIMLRMFWADMCVALHTAKGAGLLPNPEDGKAVLKEEDWEFPMTGRSLSQPTVLGLGHPTDLSDYILGMQGAGRKVCLVTNQLEFGAVFRQADVGVFCHCASDPQAEEYADGIAPHDDLPSLCRSLFPRVFDQGPCSERTASCSRDPPSSS